MRVALEYAAAVVDQRVLETADGSRLLTRMEISPVGFGRLFIPVFGRFMARQERANMAHIRRAMEAGGPGTEVRLR